jgi:hypothetical protein
LPAFVILCGLFTKDLGDFRPFHPSPLNGHRRPDNPLEDVAQYVTLAETTQPVGREGRVMRDLVFEIELTEPAIR